MNQVKSKLGAFRFYCVSLSLIGLAAYLGFLYGDHKGDRQAQEIVGLNSSVSELNQENHQLIRQLNILGVELEVAHLANQQSQQMIMQEEDNSARLREELSMYQKVMAPELNEDGFSVNSVKVNPSSVANTFRLSLILVQQNKSKGYVKGTVALELKGSLDGRMKTIDLVPMLKPNQTSVPFSFRYFELVDGEFSLPEGFKAEQLIVHSRIRTSKKRSADLERTFNWQEILADS